MGAPRFLGPPVRDPTWVDNVAPRYEQRGAVMFDFAIDGVPFLSGANNDFPYTRESGQSDTRQQNKSNDPGEQGLDGWWYRSQTSFHLGAGIKFFDVVRDETLLNRFADSHGVDVFTPGEVSLLRSCSLARPGTGRTLAVSYSNSGEEGVLHATGDTLHKVSSAGAATPVTWGGDTGMTIACLETDGGSYFVGSHGAVFRGALPGQSGSEVYQAATRDPNVRMAMGWAKQRLVVALNERLYVLSGNPGTPAPRLTTAPVYASELDPVHTHPQAGWTWTDVAEGPDAIFVTGWAGDRGAVYALRLQQSSSGPPTLTSPSVVAELPTGEVPLSVKSYMSTYLIIGTNLGVRVAVMDQNGGLTLGPLSVHSDANVTAVAAHGDNIWASGSNCDGQAGLYRLSLAQPVPRIVAHYPQASQTYPWSRGLFHPSQSFGPLIGSICSIGQTGRLAWTIDGVGLMFESASARVPSGWIETGKIRMDTWEDKIFQFLRVTNQVTTGKDNLINAQWRDGNGALSTLGVWSTKDARGVDASGSDADPMPFIGYRFGLFSADAANGATPVLYGYQVRCNPSHVVQRTIRVPLLCMERESGLGGRVVQRPVWPRVQAIEAAEATGAVVRFQDLGTGEESLALIDKTQFVASHNAASRSEQANKDGLLLVTLRLVE